MLDVKGIAKFEVEANYDDGDKDSENRIITVKPENVDWEREIHDAERQMGCEYVYIGTTIAEDFEITWHVYEYAHNINHVDCDCSGLSLIQDFHFSSTLDDDYSDDDNY